MAGRRSHQPPSIIAGRLESCRKRIQQKSANGYLITNRTDQIYLTGFEGEDGGILILPKRVYLLTDGRFAEEAAKAVPWASAVVRTGRLSETIAGLARRHRIQKLGFQPEHLSVADHTALRRAVQPTRMVPIPQVVDGLRLLKDESEVACITRAVRVAESAFRAAVRRIRLGMTERELAGELQHQIVCRGGSETSFPIIVAEGQNAALPHARPGNRKIRAGSAVLIDWGATVDHYHSDLTRVVFVRRIPPRFRRMYENVLAAQIEAIRAIRPGVRMGDVDAKARDVLKRAGMDQWFSHGLGHGLGLDVHEAPRLAMKVTDRLVPGMVVTVEPGVYFPGFGGVRIEDDVLVTDDGARVLSNLSRDLNAMVIRGGRRSA